MPKLLLVFLALILWCPAGKGADYLVLSGMGKEDPYYAAAKEIAGIHQGKIIAFDPQQLTGLADQLRQEKPLYVALVLRPDQIDYNFARSFLQLATEIDGDPFVDFAYGYITGLTATDAVKLARTAKKFKTCKAKDLAIARLGVWGLKKSDCQTWPTPWRKSTIPTISGRLAAGKNFPASGRDEKFILNFLPRLQGYPLVVFGGHGMPDHISGGPRAKEVLTSPLAGAVVLNVACYTGVTGGYFLRDWRAGVMRKNQVKPADSFCLAVIRAGAIGYTAYTCPRPAGPELECDLCALAGEGLSLGEARRRDYDKTVLGFLGYGETRMKLAPLAGGTKLKRFKDVVRGMMLEGATGGILYGDPALQPFSARPGDHPVSRIYRQKGKNLHITLSCLPARIFVMCNDPTARFDTKRNGMKLYARVPLGKKRVANLKIQSMCLGKIKLESRLVWALEHDRGQNYLQMKVVFPRPRMVGQPIAKLIAEFAE